MNDKPSDRAIAQAVLDTCNLFPMRTGWDTIKETIYRRAREIDAAVPEGAQAAMPNPVGWCRVKNGQYEVQIGGERPHDRGNGQHSPWANLYDAPALRAYGESCARAVPPSQDAEDAARYRRAVDDDLLWEDRSSGSDYKPCSDGCCGGCAFYRVDSAAIDAARAAEGDGNG